MKRCFNFNRVNVRAFTQNNLEISFCFTYCVFQNMEYACIYYTNIIIIVHMDLHINVLTEISPFMFNVISLNTFIVFQADVIVNSTNKDLEMSKGTMSKQLLKVAGQGIQNECEKKYPRGIPHGEMAVTSPGRLSSCKQIFHVALPRCQGDQDLKVCNKFVFILSCYFLYQLLN